MADAKLHSAVCPDVRAKEIPRIFLRQPRWSDQICAGKFPQHPIDPSRLDRGEAEMWDPEGVLAKIGAENLSEVGKI